MDQLVNRTPSTPLQVPCLHSPRLELRPYRQGDFDGFAALNADEAVRRHVGGPLSRAEARRLFQRCVAAECLPGHETWAVTVQTTGEYIGHCWFLLRDGADCPELGFLVGTAHWRQGYGTEIARALIDYAVTQAGYARLLATVDCDHTASIRALERAGMRRERVERDEEGIYFVYSTIPPGNNREG